MITDQQIALGESSMGAWQEVLQQRIPLFGHRNWIVIADSAYPAHAREGIETIVSNAHHLRVLQEVIANLAACKHVRPIIYIDQESSFIREEDAPGISVYRSQISELLRGHALEMRPHQEIISMLGAAGEAFRALVIKTSMTVPYTSIFLQLECGYWSADAERRLRAVMEYE